MIGRGVSRVDGPAKVTGQATYAYEHHADDTLYGVVITATIARGQIQTIDVSKAEQAPGVRVVLTHENVPAQGVRDESIPWAYWRAHPTISGTEIHHYGDAIGLVVATTLEQAQAASRLVKVQYKSATGHFDLHQRMSEAYAPAALPAGFPPDTDLGDFDQGFAAAPYKVDQHYVLPWYFAQPMEPNACTVVPRGDDLFVYVGTQIVDASRASIAATIRVDPERIHVISPFVGGGFGSKLRVHAEAILAVLAAQHLNQAVKVTLTRRQIVEVVGARPASLQRIRLGAGEDGRLIAVAHEAITHTNPKEEFADPIAVSTRSLYAAPHRRTRHRLVQLDMLDGEDVRAPGEASGLLGLECAMDELAHEVGVDPVELRIRNEPARDPERDVPFSERLLVECLKEGAARFGWSRRPDRPASVRDGRWLIGYGAASATRVQPIMDAAVRVRIEPDGNAVVLSDMTDIGTGTYTILTQLTAEELGLPMELVRVELGRSDLPKSMGSAGSWGAASATVALHNACEKLRQMLAHTASNDPRSPLHGQETTPTVFSEGRLSDGALSEPLSDVMARNHPAGLEAEGICVNMMQDPNYADYSIATYGAHFAEVRVDSDTAEVRVSRMLGVFAPGRILNAKTARSQLIGGMTFGLGMALLEGAVPDAHTGAFVNADLAEYLVPVHADVTDIDAVFVDGFDDKANAIGVKGLGELGICGSAAAVANAVFNATGARVREFPITIDKLLPALRDSQRL
ncbi:MAG: xanthine dehydrogenase YagR molybdenum-binding subunit [Mycobacterium sp.]|jgi:xanthine dehydrogenase YagR molybdenum-binding subunit|nr:xanthine dehydrogenase YagR molybdenum-binding subunit [Mycobacterium sp.]